MHNYTKHLALSCPVTLSYSFHKELMSACHVLQVVAVSWLMFSWLLYPDMYMMGCSRRTTTTNTTPNKDHSSSEWSGGFWINEPNQPSFDQFHIEDDTAVSLPPRSTACHQPLRTMIHNRGILISRFYGLDRETAKYSCNKLFFFFLKEKWSHNYSGSHYYKGRNIVMPPFLRTYKHKITFSAEIT